MGAPSPALPAAIGGLVSTTPGSWQRVAGTFVATGSEKYALIGYFGPSGVLSPYYSPVTSGPAYGVIPNSKLKDRAYYFLEDVTVQAMPEAGAERSLACGYTTKLGTCALPTSSGATYSWSPVTGLDDPNSANPTFTASGTGSYVYTLTITLPAQAVAPGQPAPTTTYTSQVAITVVDPPALTITASTTTPCLGSTFTLTASGGGPAATYTWSPATGLNSATGQTVVVTARIGMTYTVTSSCNASARIELDVQRDCCPAEAEERQVILLGNQVYTTSPFTTPGAAYRASGNLYLDTDYFVLDEGSTLYMDDDASIYVKGGAFLELNGATITASCLDMWGGVYIEADAAGVLTRTSKGRRSVVEHSYYGFVLQEPASRPTPTFAFTSTDFRQNYQSIEIKRQLGTLPDDEIYDCTFDSDPTAFKTPLKESVPYLQVYSQQHIMLLGDARAWAWESNLFRNAIMGIVCEKPYGWMVLQDNRFENCYYAGVCNRKGVDFGAAQPTVKVVLSGNTFRLPDAPLTTAQLASVVNLIGGAATTCFGAELSYQTVEALSNTFWCADAGQLYTNYDFAPQRGELQIGLQTRELQKAIGNTFQTLAIGLGATITAGESAEIRGNMFLDCERGERLTPVAAGSPMADPVVFNSCNTYARDATRPGTAYGIVVETSISPAPLVFENLDYPGGALKDLFEDQGYGGSGFYAIANNTGNTIVYRTIDSYDAQYQGWSYGTTFSPLGAVSVDDDKLYPCRLDGFPLTGIQQRTTVSPPTLAVIRPTIQSAPNPCSGSTDLHYQVPTTARQVAVRLQRGTDGRELATLTLSPRATTYQLNVQPYPAGIYFYTLLVDGVPQGTHRLLVQ